MQQLRRLNNIFSKKAIVLMYHRVANVMYDPWALSVSPKNFEEQIEVLSKSFKVVELDELIDNHAVGKLNHKTICITFDDGYTDNFLHAKPILENFNSPATFFIASDYIGSGKLFWWDLLEDIMLGSIQLPTFISIEIAGKIFEYSLKDPVLNEAQINEQNTWRWPAEPPNDRCRLYLAIWEQLLPLTLPEINKALEFIVKWAGFDEAPKNDKVPMTFEQLNTFSDKGLFTLGIHTATHAALPFHSSNYQQAEMNRCKTLLKKHFTNISNAIAYPYGRYNEASVQAARNAGIKAGFTTSQAAITKKSDILALGRMQVCNWAGNGFKKQVDNWFANC